MSLFTKILDKLGIKKKDTTGPSPAPPAGPAPATRPGPATQPGDARPGTTPASRPPAQDARPGTTARPAPTGPARPTVAPPSAPAPAPMSEVDVVKKLEQMSAGKNLNWKVSIVDLLKLLDLDSSREARTELAKELGAPSDVMGDSARMNTWLHKEVLRKIAENGGNIPRELLD